LRWDTFAKDGVVVVLHWNFAVFIGKFDFFSVRVASGLANFCPRSVSRLIPKTLFNRRRSGMTNNEQPEQIQERRGKPRVNCSYPAKVSGYTSGMKFETRAVLSNVSASGMYLRMKRRLDLNEPVFVIVRLSTTPLQNRTMPRIAANGSVVRVEPKSDGTYGVALQLDEHSFP
jgi:hypothetical protein